MLGSLNPMSSAETCMKVSQTLKEKWGPVLSASMKQRWKDGKINPYHPNNILPNKQELELKEILSKELPQFEFMGSGDFWIGPCISGKCRNPDFVYKDARAVILLNGEFWHPPEKATEEETDYIKYGWKILVIWSKELRKMNRENLLKKIRSFGEEL